MSARLNISHAVLKTAIPAALVLFVFFGILAAGITIAPKSAGAECVGGYIVGKTANGQTFDTGVKCSLSNPTPSSGSAGGDSQDLFKFINESPDSSTGNQGTPAAPETGASDTGIHGFDEIQGLGEAQTVNTLGGASCGGSASGGAGANALGGILDGLSPSSVISCVSGTNCPNVAGNLAGGALNTLAGQTGISPALLNTALGVAQGGDTKQALLNLGIRYGVSQVPRLLQTLGLTGGGGAAGAAADAVGSALHLGGANPIGSLIGGSLSVPTKETNQKGVLDPLRITADSTRALDIKETCTDGIASRLAGQATSEWVKATIEHANEQSITNWQVFASTVDENVFKDIVGGINDPDVKKLLIKTYEEDTSSKKILQSKNTPTELSPLEEFEAVFVTKTKPTRFAQYVNAYDSFAVQRTAAGDAIDRLGIADGLRSQVVCIGKDGTRTKGLIETCPTSFEIETPASVISDQRNRAVAAGQEQVADVDEVTDNVNPLLAQFVQRLFAQGLSNLSRRDSAVTPAPAGAGSGFPGNAAPGAGAGETPPSGAAEPGADVGPGTDIGPGRGSVSGGAEPPPDSGSSYLDQLSNTATDTSINAARSLLTRNISVSIAAEESYQRTLADMVQDIAFAAGAFDQVRLCYVGLTQRVSTGISTATALEKANQASSTIAAIFVPQIERRVAEFSSSELVVGELVRIGGLARDARNADELNAASDSFDALLSSGLVHSETDLVFLENDRAAAAVALQQVANEADNQLAECRQF